MIRRPVAVIAFTIGFAMRGILTWTEAPWWVTYVVYAVLLFLAVFGERELPRNVHASVKIHIPVVESPYVPGDRIFVINPNLRARLFDGDPEAWKFRDREPDWNHLPGCRKRTDAMATCICGGRGKLLLICPFKWSVKDEVCPVNNNGLGAIEHRCSLVYEHRKHAFPPPCRCACGAEPPKAPDGGS